MGRGFVSRKHPRYYKSYALTPSNDDYSNYEGSNAAETNNFHEGGSSNYGGGGGGSHYGGISSSGTNLIEGVSIRNRIPVAE